jgi:hypothetical protein
MKKVLPALCGRGGLCVDELSIVLGGRGGASLYGERILDRFACPSVNRRLDPFMLCWAISRVISTVASSTVGAKARKIFIFL